MSSRAWTWRQAITKSDLPPTTRHVLLTLSLYMNDVGGGCYPTTKQLEEATGLSERAVITHLQLARERGWLIAKEHGFKGQKWKNHEYEATWPEEDIDWKGTEPSSAGFEEGTERHSKGTEPNDEKALNEVQCNTPLQHSNNTPLPPISPKGDLPDHVENDFQIVWDSWPRRKGTSRKNALSAYRRLTKRDRDQCFDGAMAYALTQSEKIEKDRGVERFCCHLSTFINQRRWETILEEAE